MYDNGLNRRQFLKMTAAGCAVGSLLGRSARSAESPGVLPNIVFIMADDLGWNCLLYTSPSPRDS